MKQGRHSLDRKHQLVEELLKIEEQDWEVQQVRVKENQVEAKKMLREVQI